MLDTIESTLKENYKTDKNSSSSNDSTDSMKRRRNSDASANFEDYSFTKSADRSKKRVTNSQNKTPKACSEVEPDYYSHLLDDDLDFVNDDFENNNSNTRSNQNSGGRVLPSW